MPLIYLDTSNLSRLARTLSSSPSRFRDFIDVWRAKECQLAFSRTHLIELRQHSDSSVRKERYAVLKELLPIRTEIVVRTTPRTWPVLLEAREIIRYLAAEGMVAVNGPSSEDWLRVHTQIFPESIESADHVSLIQSFEDEAFGNLVEIARSAIESETKAKTRAPGTKYERRRVSDLIDAPLTTDQVEAGLQKFREAMEDDDLLRELYPLMTPDDARAGLHAFSEPLRRMMRRAGEIGMRGAYAEALGVQADLTRDRRPLDLVTQEAVFAESVRRTARQHLNRTDASEIEALVHRVSLRNCPGMWLARAVELKIRSAEPEPEISNAYDLDHVSHVPYVDLFFTDKRIANYIRQAIRDPAVPEVLRNYRGPVAVSDSIDAIEAALP